jgi:ATP-binding cassette subfamily B protein RaxB
MQEDTLFAGNIYENIAFFASSINHNKIIDCAKVAGIHDEIMKLPMNYQTFIGDMGTVLSGGQKQRVLLARALYHDPKVIFLDESTSHLDAQKEKEINEALKKINITKIIIAHRLETIKSADKILDLTK